MDREAWCAAHYGVTKSRAWLSDWTELDSWGRELTQEFPEVWVEDNPSPGSPNIKLCW